MTHNATSDLSETKRHLLEAGISLIRKKGFHATSVDEICLEAEVTKGAFFHYFKSKEDLAKTAIVWFEENKKSALAEAPFRKIADPLDRLFARLDFLKDSYHQQNQLTKGCLFGMFAQEISFINPALRALCLNAFEHIATDLEQDLVAAKMKYAPDAGFNPKDVAMLYVSLIQGSLLIAKASASNAVICANIDQYRSYLKTLFAVPAARSQESLATAAL